ncbi:MAG: ATP phosphoribosyltransferase [Acidimicrobiales bacterium]
MTAAPTIRVAIPSKGRLREQCLDLLKHAGYSVGAFKGDNASAVVDGIEFIEMRPRDAAAWLKAGRLSAAFISTDTALESNVEDFPAIELGFAKSDLIVACRDADSFQCAADLAGGTVATHLPDWTRRWFASQGIDVTVVAMGGSLEGVCAVGMADAIVDLRETGGSLARNRLRVIEEVENCQAIFANTVDPSAEIDDLRLRIGAALSSPNAPSTSCCTSRSARSAALHRSSPDWLRPVLRWRCPAISLRPISWSIGPSCGSTRRSRNARCQRHRRPHHRPTPSSRDRPACAGVADRPASRSCR